MKRKLGKLPCYSNHCRTMTPQPFEYYRIDDGSQTISHRCEECGRSGFIKHGEAEHAAVLHLFAAKPDDDKPTKTKPAAAGGLNLGAL